MVANEDCDPNNWLYLGCCCFYLGMYEEAEAAGERGPECPLQNRLLFHIAHKVGSHGLRRVKRLKGGDHNRTRISQPRLPTTGR